MEQILIAKENHCVRIINYIYIEWHVTRLISITRLRGAVAPSRLFPYVQPEDNLIKNEKHMRVKEKIFGLLGYGFGPGSDFNFDPSANWSAPRPTFGQNASASCRRPFDRTACTVD